MRPRLGAREAMLIGAFAVFLVAARAAMRWHIHVPGHSTLAVAFGLVLLRACVDRRSAATLCGVLAGALCAGLGMGKGGPLIVLKLALPGAVVDLLWPRRREGSVDAPLTIARGAWIGGLAGASGVASLLLVEWLADVDPVLIGLHALASATGKAIFGAAGGAAAVWVAGELRHHGLLSGTPATEAESAATLHSSR